MAVPPFPRAAGADPAAVFARAAQLHQAGRLQEARPLYEAVLRAAPRHADALHLLGHLLLQTGEPRRALQLIGKAIDLAPRNPAYRYNRGLIHQQAGELDRAAADFAAVTALAPDDVDAWASRGETLLALGRAEEALASYDRALALRPDVANLRSSRGAALRRLGRLAEALAAQDDALALAPRSAAILGNRGNVLMDLGRLEEALQAFDRSLGLDPRPASAWTHRGNALRGLRRLAEALASHERACALAPDDPDAHYHRALVLQDLGRLADALAAFDQALARAPQDPRFRFAKGAALLLAGELRAGWPLYEARRALSADPVPRALRRPAWTGGGSLAGRTLLLHAEQGLGDTLQFCRFAAVLAERGARVVLQVQPPLAPLLRAALEGAAEVLPAGLEPPPFDLHCPLLSLPLALGLGPGDIPGAAPYLRADPAKAQAWAARLGPRDRPRVGLAWSGRSQHLNDRNRSLPLAELLAALPAGLDYVSLQQEVRPQDAAALGAVRHFGEALLDFSDTAALAAGMDAVVAVDTSLAHLAGALGLDTRLLLPRVGLDWRWGAEGEASPWYPSMRLYRQGEDCGWGAPLAALARDLHLKAAH